MLKGRISDLHRLACTGLRAVTMAQSLGSSSKGGEIHLNFDNKVLRELPVDKSRVPGSRQVPGACFSLVNPTPVKSPKVVAVSKSALSLLEIKDGDLKHKDLAEYFSGNKIFPGSETASHCYCGHQFGYFSGQLGDGAAIYLGEVVNEKKERWEVQLKGAGLTPYSRTADGRKVLRSSIREFLCSEAIHNLGIPTTRAGTCVTSDSRVNRDIFYDGNQKNEQCTIVSRIAETFLRFGSFEIFKPTDEETGRAGPSVGKHEILKKMLEYVSESFFPSLKEQYTDKETVYVEMYRDICKRTARLVAGWQCVGFCHGVLNTDNMSILGLTIDYGPFGFMERFDPEFVCNGSDDGGRYSYKNQPDICKWNLKKFAEAIQWEVPLAKTLPVLEKEYQKEYDSQYIKIMRKKLGLVSKSLPDDEKLVEELLKTMSETNADFTSTFRALSAMPLPKTDRYSSQLESLTERILSTCFSLEELKVTCKPVMDPRQLQAILALARENPAILQMLTGGRMGMIKNEIENLEKMETMKNMTEDDLLKENKKKWKEWLTEYEKRLVKEVEGCTDLKEAKRKRVDIMNATNPCFILRNYIAQNAIDEAESGNFEEVQKVLKLLEHPYEANVDLSEFSSASAESEDSAANTSSSESGPSSEDSFAKRYANAKTPLWALQLRVT